MKITVKRTGGFAGLTENITDLDTSQLESGTAEKVAAKVRKIGFFDYPAVLAAGAVGADMYQYEVTVTDGPRHHSVAFSEGAPEAAPLLDLVQTLEKIK
ncbi:MAG TPA: protealysin inhibitor emfourin [Terriglobales bacterium]|nr:protealysin inhibitor emfourin [Terriglobales bacterium]